MDIKMDLNYGYWIMAIQVDMNDCYSIMFIWLWLSYGYSSDLNYGY